MNKRDSYIIFDLDGTLLDTSNRQYKLYIQLYEELISTDAKPLSRGQFWTMKRSGYSTVELLPREIGSSVRQEFLELWKERIESTEYLRYDSVFDGVTETLCYLRKNDYKLFLLTRRSDSDNLRWELDEVGISRYFLDTYIVSHEGPPKDAVINEQLGELTPADFVVGDTADDLEAGNRLGATTIAVNTGIRNKERQTAANPDLMLESVNDIREESII